MKKLLNSRGFSLLEMLISVVIIVFVLLAENSFLFSMFSYNARAKIERETVESANEAMEIMAYEIRGAKGVYTPTTTATQLSLETERYIPTGQNTGFVDFYLCGASICFKKEGQAAVFITPDNMLQVTSLTFTPLMNDVAPSVKIDLTASYKDASINLSSTASIRNY